MAYLTASDWTVTSNPRDRQPFGRKKMCEATLTLKNYDSKNYPYDGIPLPDKANFGFNKAIDDMIIMDHPGALGYMLKYDQTNHKLVIYHKAPPVVMDELMVVGAGKVGYTKYPAAFINYISSDAPNPIRIVDKDTTPGAGEVAVDLHSSAPGTRATLTFQAADTYYVSYITQAWQDVFQNLVESEAPTVSTSVAVFDYAAVAIQTVDVDGDPVHPLKKGQTASSMFMEVDFSDSGASSVMTVTGAGSVLSSASAVKATYIKDPGSGFLNERFSEEVAMDMSGADSATVSYAAGWNHVLIFGDMGTLKLGSKSSKARGAEFIWTGGSAGDSTEVLLSTYLTAATKVKVKASRNSSMAAAEALDLVGGHPSEISPLIPLELPDNTPLSLNIVFRVQVWGM